MSEEKTTVMMGVVQRGATYLLGRKREGYSHSGMWEFPGGKLEAGETPEVGMLRELDEELGIQGNVSKLLGSFELEDYVFLVFLVELVSGPHFAKDHDVWGWFYPAEMQDLPMGEADQRVVKELVQS